MAQSDERVVLETLADLVHEAYQLFGWVIMQPEHDSQRLEELCLKWMDNYAEKVAMADSIVGKYLDELIDEDR